MLTTPIFLVGAERSGTTLLRLMLDHHPQIAFHHEFEFAVDQLDEAGNWPALSAYHEYLATHRIFAHSRFTIDPSLSYPELVNSFLLQKMQRDHKPLVGATVHYEFHQLLKIWPQAKFIHLLRDGRDVARSTMVMGWAGNMFTGVERWIEAEQLWQTLSRQLSADQHITVQYEQLAQHADQVLTQLCEFIGVPFTPAMYDYATRSTYSLPNPKSLSQWRKLSNYEVQLAESRIGLLLSERGYPLSGLPPVSNTPWLRWRLQVQDRWARRLFRLRRYPLRLYLKESLARHLKLKKWHSQALLEINTYDERRIK